MCMKPCKFFQYEMTLSSMCDTYILQAEAMEETSRKKHERDLLQKTKYEAEMTVSSQAKKNSLVSSLHRAAAIQQDVDHNPAKAS